MAVTTGVLPQRYAKPRLIGHGGMGEIYLAEDRELGRKVAVKVLADRFARDEALQSRFTREALAAARGSLRATHSSSWSTSAEAHSESERATAPSIRTKRSTGLAR